MWFVYHDTLANGAKLQLFPQPLDPSALSRLRFFIDQKFSSTICCLISSSFLNIEFVAHRVSDWSITARTRAAFNVNTQNKQTIVLYLLKCNNDTFSMVVINVLMRTSITMISATS